MVINSGVKMIRNSTTRMQNLVFGRKIRLAWKDPIKDFEIRLVTNRILADTERSQQFHRIAHSETPWVSLLIMITGADPNIPSMFGGVRNASVWSVRATRS